MHPGKQCIWKVIQSIRRHSIHGKILNIYRRLNDISDIFLAKSEREWKKSYFTELI